MKNNGMFSTLFIEELRGEVRLDDSARGRMATLAHKWQARERKDTDSLWDNFMKQALSYLEFVPPRNSPAPGVYPLYEDYDYSRPIAVLYLVELGADIDDTAVGRFYPAKLIARLRDHGLRWGILTDGARWRLYSTRSSRPFEDYVELPLAEALEGDDEAEYGLFERFFHRDSFVTEEVEEHAEEEGRDSASGTGRCRLDDDRDRSEQVLEKKVKAPFLIQIDEVLRYICNGFIHDTKENDEEESEEVKAEIFGSAVKFIYRCLFLFYAEARELLPSDLAMADQYRPHSMRALCREARKFQRGDRRDTGEYDLWKHLKGLIHAVYEGDPEYGTMGYDGGLFDDEKERFLGRHQLRNDFLARALYLLAFVEPTDDAGDEEYPIPYEDLEVRHLGELHESILEWTVQIADADRIRRPTKKGFEIRLASGDERRPGDTLIHKGEVFFSESALERKQTGSYYTPQSLVRFLNEKTIVRPLREAFENRHRHRFDEFLDQARKGHDEGTRRGAAQSAVALVERFVEEEVLAFKVCDPAMGSGHFLVDAANQMAGLIVSLLEEVPDVEGAPAGVASRPNDWRRLVTRHCLYGVDLNPLAVELARLSLWLNGFARDHKLTFLDHHLCRGNSLIGIRSLDALGGIPARKKGSRKKRDAERVILDYGDRSGAIAEAVEALQSIEEIDEDDTEAQAAAHDQARAAMGRLHSLADLHTAYLMDPEIRTADFEALFNCLATDRSVENTLDPLLPRVQASVEGYRARHDFFHWPLEFPDLFGPNGPGGFSATVGNPPWDVLQPNTQEFYVDYDLGFRKYKKQEALRVIKELQERYPGIADKWQEYQRGFKEASAYFKEPVAYESLQKGKIDSYKAFLERFFGILRGRGRMGIIVPSGLYTDQGCRPLREMFFDRSEVDFLYGFENRWPTVFSAVDGRFKFVLFGTRRGGKTGSFRCCFMEHDPERLPAIDANALEMRVEQVRKFSPDTLSVMEFKSQRDIDITTKIYGDWPLLGEKIEGTWNVRFRQELNMTSDSHLFKTEPTDCPLYEGKMIWLFDSHFEKPRYWLDREEVEKALGDRAWEGRHYRVGFRDIAASTNERTLITSIVPCAWYGHTMTTVQPHHPIRAADSPTDAQGLWLTSLLATYAVDFLIRQKVTNHMSFFYMSTLPVPRLISSVQGKQFRSVIARAGRLLCVQDCWDQLWRVLFSADWQSPSFWYPPSVPIDDYGPEHEREIRRRLRDEAVNLTPEWGPHCGVHDRRPDRRDTGDRAQLRAEIDAYVAHLYGLSRDDFAYILDTFPVLRRKEKKAFGEFMSKRKCLEEYDRIGKVLNAGNA